MVLSIKLSNSPYRNLTIVDVETTGGSGFFHRIIEVGAIRIQDGEVVAQYHSLIDPGVPIPAFITGLTGISYHDVASAPTFNDVKDELIELFNDAVFVAHNAPFDYGFIREEFRRLGYTFAADTLCSVRLSRNLYPEFRRHNLDEIIRRFSIACPNRHRALDDARVVWEFMRHIEREFSPKKIEQAVKRVTKINTALAPEELIYEPLSIDIH